MIKKWKQLALIGALAVGLCTGCGGEKNEYTKAGMDSIAALDYQTAMSDFEQARANEEDIRLIARGEGIVHLAMTEYGAAVESFTEALNAGDGVVEDMDYDINYYLATAFYKNEQYQEAAEVYDAILALKPNETDAWFFKGCTALKLNDYEGARADFDKAIELEPKNFDQIIEIYSAFSEEGYIDVGKEMLQNAIDQSGNAMSDYDKGRFYYFLGNYEEAKKALDSVNKDEDPQIVLYLGKSYEETGDYSYAISVYQSYLEKDKSQVQLFNQMGLCQMKMENYDEALAAFQAGMQVEGNDMMQTLKFNEIVAYEYKHDFQSAAALMSEYLKSYPDDQVAKREYEFLKTR